MTKDIIHLTLAEPPEILFCAVDIKSYDEVYRRGLNRLKTPFIELFTSETDARNSFGKRRLSSLIAIVAKTMADDGYRFYHAETGEWLTDEVPSKYIRLQ